MRRAAHLPVTGPRATDHASARALARGAADALSALDAGKRAAAVADPGRDLSAENAAKARREGWRDGSLGGQHTPDQ